MYVRVLCLFLLTASVSADAARQRTYEEAMERQIDNPYVHEIHVAQFEYHYGYQYGKHIWSGTRLAELGDPLEGQILLPDLNDTFALIDTITLGPEAGLKTLLWGFQGCPNTDCRVRNAKIQGYHTGLAETAIPNVAYYRYTESSDSDIDDQALKPVFDDAIQLFQSLYNTDGRCRLNGWTEKRQYFVVKGVIYKPGQRYRHYFKCDSEFSDDELGVEVGAIAINVGDVGVFAYVSTRCELPLVNKRKKTVSDLTACGFSRAAAHREIFDNNPEWIQVAIGPSVDDPATMEMHTRYRQVERVDPASSPLKEKMAEKIREYSAHQEALDEPR